MFPKVLLFSCLLLISIVEFSSVVINESKCNDQIEPTIFDIFDSDGDKQYTLTLKMESTDPFEPILSLMVTRQYFHVLGESFTNSIWFEFTDKSYVFSCEKYDRGDPSCESFISSGEMTPNNCTVTKNTCQWLMKVGVDPLVDHVHESHAKLMDMISQSKNATITLVNSRHDYHLTNNLIKLPIYQWSYARSCEYNKKIYDFNAGIITLKKKKDSFELFIYRYTKKDDGNYRKVTLVNSKNNKLKIVCKHNSIFVSAESGSDSHSVSEKDIFKRHSDSLRCGISLSINMETEFSSFSFNDTPLKLIYDFGYWEYFNVPTIQFESDSADSDETKIETITSTPVTQEDSIKSDTIQFDSDYATKIETTSTPHVDPDYINDSQDVTTKDLKSDFDFITEDEADIETITATTPVDEEAVNENQENNKVNPLIGVALTIITIVKSYFDLW